MSSKHDSPIESGLRGQFGAYASVSHAQSSAHDRTTTVVGAGEVRLHVTFVLSLGALWDYWALPEDSWQGLGSGTWAASPEDIALYTENYHQDAFRYNQRIQQFSQWMADYPVVIKTAVYRFTHWTWVDVLAGPGYWDWYVVDWKPSGVALPSEMLKVDRSYNIQTEPKPTTVPYYPGDAGGSIPNENFQEEYEAFVNANWNHSFEDVLDAFRNRLCRAYFEDESGKVKWGSLSIYAGTQGTWMLGVELMDWWQQNVPQGDRTIDGRAIPTFISSEPSGTSFRNRWLWVLGETLFDPDNP